MKTFYTLSTGPMKMGHNDENNIFFGNPKVLDNEEIVMEHDSEKGWRIRTLKGEVHSFEGDKVFEDIFDTAVKKGTYIPYNGELAEVHEIK